jgi:hypothetical protein
MQLRSDLVALARAQRMALRAPRLLAWLHLISRIAPRSEP